MEKWIFITTLILVWKTKLLSWNYDYDHCEPYDFLFCIKKFLTAEDC